MKKAATKVAACFFTGAGNENRTRMVSLEG